MGTSAVRLLVALCLGIVCVSSSEILLRQKRNWIVDSYSIEEEHPGPFPYFLGKIDVDMKVQVGFNLHGEGVDKEPKNMLKIDTKTGNIYVLGKLDYEAHQVLRLTFEAHGPNDPKDVHTRLGLEVAVLDINDHPPIFTRDTYYTDVKESDKQGKYIITVVAIDGDSSATNNGTFDLKIVSVSPDDTDVEFFLDQRNTAGTINFKGCLDHEKAEKYTILVEAKDRGDVKKFSTTCTVIVNVEDENNHMPVFIGQTGVGTVKERETGLEVLRVQVSDSDTRGTKAWKAKYTIHGDENNQFTITTDPETNEGVLFVEKSLDYEKGALRKLSISLENEIPYFTCTVKGRPEIGLWDVDLTGGESGTAVTTPVREVTVAVEDVNDPPVFTDAVKTVLVDENVPVGHYLETFTAVDLDGSYANSFLYTKGEDPYDCVAVDSKTGKITTTKILDREAPDVVNNIYTVTILAVDDGEPPMTGTGTLKIQLNDENDNFPLLSDTTLAMCIGVDEDETSVANITASDLDENPYGGPFNFHLEGDVKGKWRIEPTNGYKVNLVKEGTVHAGHHELQLRVFDLQGQSILQNLSVTVCQCSDSSDAQSCFQRRSNNVQLGAGAIGIFFLALLLLLVLLLLALLLSCKSEKKFIPTECYGEHLIKSNIETPGTDCMVPLPTTFQIDNQEEVETQYPAQQMQMASAVEKSSAPPASFPAPAQEPDGGLYSSEYSLYQQRNQPGQFQRTTSTRKSATMKSSTGSMMKSSTGSMMKSSTGSMMKSSTGSMMKSSSLMKSSSMTKSQNTNGYAKGLNRMESMSGMRTTESTSAMRMMGTGSKSMTTKNYSSWGDEGDRSDALFTLLSQRTFALQSPGAELGDYAPYPYAEEGDLETDFQLDAISIPEIPFDTDMLLYLSPRFNTLATICRPDAAS